MTPDEPSARLAHVLTRLKGARRSGGQWSAKCPAHDDRDPSLRVSDGREPGYVVLTCRTGCEVGAVLKAARLSWADVMPESEYASYGIDIEAAYPYRDESGRVLSEQIRWAGRSDRHRFAQRQPDGLGDWVWNVEGVPYVPYRLPELIAAVRAGETIYVVEGERDAEAAAALGLASTTMRGGVKKWRGEYSSVLAGATVVVVADADRPGIEHARSVALDLEAHDCDVTTLKPATGKDLSDHLNAGLSIDHLVPLDARRLNKNGREFYAMTPESWIDDPELSDAAFRLLAKLDFHQGTTLSPFAGKNNLAAAKGWGKQKTLDALEELSTAGRIRIREVGGRRRQEIQVVDNPARGPALDQRSNAGPVASGRAVQDQTMTGPALDQSENTSGPGSDHSGESRGSEKDLRDAELEAEALVMREIPGVEVVPPRPPVTSAREPRCGHPLGGESFNRFWSAYPRTDRKRAAIPAFERELEEMDAETLIECADRFAMKCAGMRIEDMPMAVTWLERKLWRAELAGVSHDVRTINEKETP